MRSLPFNTAASQCATSDLGMQPGASHNLDVSPPCIMRDYMRRYSGWAELGSLARASFSSQTVACFSVAHITRAR
jgi:hypothetical protein